MNILDYFLGYREVTLDELYLVTNLGFIVLGYRGLRAIYGLVLGGSISLFYAFLTDPEVMTGLLVFTGGIIWLVIIVFGAIMGGIFTLMGAGLHRIVKRSPE